MSDRKTLLKLAKVAKAFVECLERWPDEQLSGNSPELPDETCSPRCETVTPLAAGDETVTELGRLAASVLSEDTLRRLDAMRRDDGETVTVFEFDDDDRLRAAALALYEAGAWSSPNVPLPDAAEMWANLRDALGLEPGHATERGVGAESRAPETSSREAVTAEPAVAIIGPGSTQAERWLPGEIGAESPEPVLYVVWYDGDDTPYAASCCTTAGECEYYFLLPHDRKGKVVPLYAVPVDAAREIAAARREAEEARAECERLRITDKEREAIADCADAAEAYMNDDIAATLRALNDRHARETVVG
jgi:hypothetical protein